MTRDFEQEIMEAVKVAQENTFTKVYEENKKLVRPYLRLVLEVIKSFNFYEKEFDKKMILEKKELIGNPKEIYLDLNKKNKRGSIELEYVTDGRLQESKIFIKPNYLAEETFNKHYMGYLLSDEGIKVLIRRADGCTSTSDYIEITFDATVIVEALKEVDQKIKRRAK